MKTVLPAVVSAAVVAGLRLILQAPDAADVRDGLRALVRGEVRAALAEDRRETLHAGSRPRALPTLTPPCHDAT